MERKSLLLFLVLLGVFVLGFGVLSRDSAPQVHTVSQDQGHTETISMDPEFAPALGLEVSADPHGGWNVRILTERFSFAPDKVNTPHVLGEGHAHYYIDGIKQGRVYGEWLYVPALDDDVHTLSVALTSNNHKAYVVEGEEVRVSVELVPHSGMDHAE